MFIFKMHNKIPNIRWNQESVNFTVLSDLYKQFWLGIYTRVLYNENLCVHKHDLWTWTDYYNDADKIKRANA